MKPYEAVMVLNLHFNGDYYDCRGTYIKLMTLGRYKGLNKVEVDSTAVYVPNERIMDLETYFKQYNEDKSKLPPEAAKRLFFAQGDHK